jgi:hypothetical protein
VGQGDSMLGPSGSSAWQVRAGKSCSAPNLTREIHNVSITFLHLALSHVFRIHHKNGFEPMRQKNRMFPSKKPHCRSAQLCNRSCSNKTHTVTRGTSAMTSSSDGAHPADSASGPSGCPRHREKPDSKVQKVVSDWKVSS